MLTFSLYGDASHALAATFGDEVVSPFFNGRFYAVFGGATSYSIGSDFTITETGFPFSGESGYNNCLATSSFVVLYQGDLAGTVYNYAKSTDGITFETGSMTFDVAPGAQMSSFIFFSTDDYVCFLTSGFAYRSADGINFIRVGATSGIQFEFDGGTQYLSFFGAIGSTVYWCVTPIPESGASPVTSVLSSNDYGLTFSSVTTNLPENDSAYFIRLFDGVFYAMSYESYDANDNRLYKSTDGQNFSVESDSVFSAYRNFGSLYSFDSVIYSAFGYAGTWSTEIYTSGSPVAALLPPAPFSGGINPSGGAVGFSGVNISTPLSGESVKNLAYPDGLSAAFDGKDFRLNLEI